MRKEQNFIAGRLLVAAKDFIGILFCLLVLVVPLFAQPSTDLDREEQMASLPNEQEVLSHFSNYRPTDFGEGSFEKCSTVIPKKHYVLAESFFTNFDNVIRRIAFLQTHGFEEATYIHTTCQDFDVDKELYAVLIKGPVANKTQLYQEISLAYKKAATFGFELVTTRIILCK